MLVLFMRGDDTVWEYSRISRAVAEGLDGVAGFGVRLGWSVAAMPPRVIGNPVDIAISNFDSDQFFLARLSSNGTVLAGSVQRVADGVGGMPSGSVESGGDFG